MSCKKQSAKKQDHCYSKREEARLLLFFLSTNDPVFLHQLLFATHILDLFFRVTHVSKTRIVGAN